MPAQAPLRRTCATKTDTPRGCTKTSPTLHQDATKSRLTYHQYHDPPNQDTTHPQPTTPRNRRQSPDDMTETPSKHHDDTHSPTWAPHSAMPTQKKPKMGQNESETAKHELNPFFCKSKFPSSNFHFHTLFIHSKFPLMPLTMLCMSACAAPWHRIN